MASYKQLFYCKNCKKNVSVNEKNQCVKCGSSSLNKSWTVRFRYTENRKEKNKRLTGYQTKKEAQDGYIKFINEIKLHEPISADEKLSFDKLFEEYKDYTKSRIKESSFYDMYSKFNKHILPHFNEYYVQDITPKIILNWQRSLEHFSYKHKTTLRGYLWSILNYADKYYNIPNNLKKVDGFRRNEAKKEMLFWTPAEFNAFIAKVDNEMYRAFFYALYYTGARKGEILATTWNDWDLKNGRLSIKSSVTKKVFGASWAITSPKNQASVRDIGLPKILVDVMSKYKCGREDFKLVFANDKPLADSNIQRVQEKACKESGVKKIRIHDFRHSHASLLISQGASIVAVAKRLGHSNIEQTLNTYAHMMPKEDDLILEILQKNASAS